MSSAIRFHHFGLAVKQFSDSLRFYNNLGYDCTKPVTDPLQNVELILCTSEHYPTVELVRPVNDKSPIINYLNKSNEIIYHICYEVNSIENVKELFSDSRAICVSEPKPAILFDNQLVSFYYIKNIGLFEVLQKS